MHVNINTLVKKLKKHLFVLISLFLSVTMCCFFILFFTKNTQYTTVSSLYMNVPSNSHADYLSLNCGELVKNDLFYNLFFEEEFDKIIEKKNQIQVERKQTSLILNIKVSGLEKDETEYISTKIATIFIELANEKKDSNPYQFIKPGFFNKTIENVVTSSQTNRNLFQYFSSGFAGLFVAFAYFSILIFTDKKVIYEESGNH